MIWQCDHHSDAKVWKFECVKKPNVLDWNWRQSWISWCYKLLNINAEPRDVRSDTDSLLVLCLILITVLFWYSWVRVSCADEWLWLAKLHFSIYLIPCTISFEIFVSFVWSIFEVLSFVPMNCSVLVWLYVCVCVWYGCLIDRKRKNNVHVVCWCFWCSPSKNSDCDAIDSNEQ